MERRHYGLDWLRIGAFGLLILYHIGMVFVPWDYHIKTAHPLTWVEWPMQLLNPWRLGLLFLISGVASRALLGKLGSVRAFAQSRSARLLVPLAAGMALWVAPQPWVELREKAGYAHGFAYFWLHDYFAFGPTFAAYKAGFILPTWNHLWFVVYLWIYTMIAAAGAALIGSRSLQRAFDRLFGGWRLFALPLLWLWVVRLALYPNLEESHALVADWIAHLMYVPLFLFGMGLAGAPDLLARAARAWPWLLGVAVIGFAVRMGFNASFADLPEPPQPALTLALLARAVQTWGTILGLIGLATAHLDRDTPVRHWLTQAVFPFYIAHQTVLIVVEHWLKPLHIGSTAEFGVLVPATVLGCLVFAAIGRRAGPFAPLFGLAARARRVRDDCPAPGLGVPLQG